MELSKETLNTTAEPYDIMMPVELGPYFLSSHENEVLESLTDKGMMDGTSPKVIKYIACTLDQKFINKIYS